MASSPTETSTKCSSASGLLGGAQWLAPPVLLCVLACLLSTLCALRVALCSLTILGLAAQVLLQKRLARLQGQSHAQKEGQLAAEAEASQALLRTVCDATVWLAYDGDTVLRSSPRFDALAGVAMQGRRLSDLLPAREKGRVRHAFLFGPGADGELADAPAAILPSTLQSADDSCRLSEVELLIVDRRLAFERVSTSCDLGFLVGVRLSDAEDVSEEKENFRQSPEAPGHAREPKSGEESEDGVATASNSGSDDLSVCEAGTANHPAEPVVHPTRPVAPRKAPLGAPWVASGEYLEECSLSQLEDLVSTWNFEVDGCCAWHSNIQLLRKFADRMSKWHSCGEQWLPGDSAPEAWQCGNCSAVLADGDAPSCWVCGSERAQDEEEDVVLTRAATGKCAPGDRCCSLGKTFPSLATSACSSVTTTPSTPSIRRRLP